MSVRWSEMTPEQRDKAREYDREWKRKKRAATRAGRVADVRPSRSKYATDNERKDARRERDKARRATDAYKARAREQDRDRHRKLVQTVREVNAAEGSNVSISEVRGDAHKTRARARAWIRTRPDLLERRRERERSEAYRESRKVSARVRRAAMSDEERADYRARDRGRARAKRAAARENPTP